MATTAFRWLHREESHLKCPVCLVEPKKSPVACTILEESFDSVAFHSTCLMQPRKGPEVSPMLDSRDSAALRAAVAIAIHVALSMSFEEP